MMYLELENGDKIAFSEYYSPSGVHITIEQPVTEAQMIEIKKQLKQDRDLLSLRFLKFK